MKNNTDPVQRYSVYYYTFITTKNASEMTVTMILAIQNQGRAIPHPSNKKQCI